MRLRHEFRESDKPFSFKGYLQREDLLFAEVRELAASHFDSEEDSIVSRYATDAPIFPVTGRDWNRSYLLAAEPERGVAVMLHGLSDSPYSLHALAEELPAEGITVYGLRLPGHGTIPGELDRVRWRDWYAAAKGLLDEVQERHPSKPLYVFGYSTGAALAVDYVMEDRRPGSRTPRRLYLISPALGVTPLARFANWQRLVTGLGVLQKARWVDVYPEVDPFKYQSFPKNAAAQVTLLLENLYEHIAAPEAAERLPEIVSFQSLADRTVNSEDLLEVLYARVNNEASELVLFDLNRNAHIEPFLQFSPGIIEQAFASPNRSYKLTTITNAHAGTREVVERSYHPASREYTERPLGLSWPEQVFSLSHVALPFPPDDPVYGYDYRSASGEQQLTLGSLQLRGETGILLVPAEEQLRLRANPFYSYLRDRIVESIRADAAP